MIPALAAFMAGGFSPPQIPGLQAWKNARDTDTITETSGDVSQWDDQSVEGNNVVQATGANQPTTSTVNGNPSILFDGSNDRLRDSSPTLTSPPSTLALVFTPTTVAAGLADMIRLRNGFDVVYQLRRDGDDLEAVEGFAGNATTMSIANVLGVNQTRWVILRARNSGDGTSDIETDEGNSDSASLAASIDTVDDYNIGANADGNRAFGGHIHEFLYYNRFLTDNEKAALGGYLSGGWTLS